MTPTLHVRRDLETVSAAAAGDLARRVLDAVASRGQCSLVLSGGRTPRRLYELLAAAHRDLPWPSVHVFWGDERYVPHDHPQSNYRLARVTLLDHVPVPERHVHPVPTDAADPARAAAVYETLVRAHLAGTVSRFDVVLLGLASDGHIASLFPGSSALRLRDRWVTAVEAPADPPRRVTMTLPLLNRTAHVIFLVAGSAKAQRVAEALQAGEDVDAVPAAGIRPAEGSVAWWMDEEAASMVDPAQRPAGAR